MRLVHTLALLFTLLVPLTSYASEKIYSIQIGSFIYLENANKRFDSLSQKINEIKLDYLRIEKVDKFYAVRIGRFEDRQRAEEFLQIIKPLSHDALIIKTYVKNNNIVRLYPEELKPLQSQPKPLPSIDPETSLARARELIKDGNYEEALSLLSPFISEPMKYPTVVSDYIVVLVWEGRHNEAIGMYENLPPSFTKRAYLLRNMAKAYYEEKDFLKAFSLYHAALQETPMDEEAQKGVLLSLIQTGDYTSASEYLKEFLERSPDSVSLAFTKAYLLFKQERYPESLKEYSILALRKDVDSEHVYKIRDDLIVSLPAEKRQSMLKELRVAIEKDPIARLDYILVLILNKEYKAAIGVFETAGLDIERYPDYLLSWIAWAYFKIGDTEKAKLYYEKILNARPAYVRANIGLAYCLAAEGQSDRAMVILDSLLVDEPKNLEIRFARAFVHEKSKRFWLAIQEYNRILEISPGNPVALKLILQNLSDLGASSLALERALSELPLDLKFHDSLRADMAVDRINWEEFEMAKSILFPLIEDRENMRARYDHIIALAENNDMEEVLKAYENLIKDGISPPPWVLENAAKAYLYLEQPEKALELYNEALKANPASFNGRMGKFYTLQELRRWVEAREVLDSLDREQPYVLGEDKYIRPNWPKLEIAVVRGWLLAHEERLREAEEYFYGLREGAPANTGIRTGLAHVYLWRGWFRKALREFKIIETFDPKYHKALIGKAITLNTLAFKEEAREIAGKLLTSHPRDKHVQQLVRQLRVEEMAEVVTDFAVTTDEDGFEDIRAEITLSKPVSLYSSLYGFLLWQQSSDDTQMRFFRRAGLGINHIFNSSWSLRQQFSVDYDDGDDFGSFTMINFYPDDYWRFRLSYDSFTTDVPLQARVFGIEANRLETGITYRESDWRSYHFTLSALKFSDDNRREHALLGYEQGLLVKNNWRMRLFLNLYLSRNSLEGAPYFNPDRDLSLSTTHLTEHTIWRIYNRALVQRLFLTLGTYKQSGFSNDAIGSIHYQHDYDFSDTHALLWGSNIARNVYDGEPVHSYSLYLNYRRRF
jgi:biofilm PGA synthesis protein PgaA